MWERMREALRRLFRGSPPGPDESEAARARDRARFWAEVREGQREAEANSRP